MKDEYICILSGYSYIEFKLVGRFYNGLWYCLDVADNQEIIYHS